MTDTRDKPVNPYRPIDPSDLAGEDIAVAWDEGFAAALAAVLSDRAVEAAAVEFRACRAPGWDGISRAALAAAVDAVKEGEAL